MDRFGRRDDSLYWEPPIEHPKRGKKGALLRSDDSDDEDEETRVSWSQTIRECLNSRIVSRTLIVVCLLLLALNFRSSLRLKTAQLETDSLRNADTDWSQFAYVQYATNKQYLCNSIMIFASLSKLKSKAKRVMLYPADWDVHPTIDSFESRLLLAAERDYDVHLSPVHSRHLSDVQSAWRDSFVKLLAFNQTSYTRVVTLDSDSTVLASMDELFMLPSAPLAMPRAYWEDDHSTLTSALMVVEPSRFEFLRIMDAIKHREYEDFDMEIVNHLYGDSALVIPHRHYLLLTGDFRRKQHKRYLGSPDEVWDPKKEYEHAKFVHFSDWPYPKPWVQPEYYIKLEVEPKCTPKEGEDCAASKIWFELYEDFRKRRLDVCGEILERKMGKGID